MKHIRVEHKILASVLILTACLVVGAASSGEEQEPQEIIFFESTIGEVIFPHQAHFEDLEIDCKTCHHEHNAAKLDMPHPEYFEDFWIKWKLPK